MSTLSLRANKPRSSAATRTPLTAPSFSETVTLLGLLMAATVA